MRGVILTFCLITTLIFSGCGNNSANNPVGPMVSNEGLANVTIKIIGNENNSIKASVNEDLAEVAFSFKLLKPDSPNDYDIVKKVSPVQNGQAEFSFQALPARVAIANIEIKNGKIGEYSAFRGAQTLKSGENNLFLVSGIGSKETPDLVAGTIEELLTDRKISAATTENLVLDIIDASNETLDNAEPNDVGLIKNIAEVYLCQKSQKLSDEVKSIFNNHLMHFLMSVSTSSQNAYNKANSFYGWTWEEGLFWSYFSGDLKLSSLQTFAFIDSSFNSYKTITSSANINGFKYGSAYKIDSISGLLEGTEVYFYTIRMDGNYDVFGTYKSSKDGEKTVQISTDKLVTSLFQPYPISGSIKIDMGINGLLTVTFNGSYVADAIYTNSSSQTVTTKLFLDKRLILSQGYVFEGNLRQSRANTLSNIDCALLNKLKAAFQALQ